MNDRLRKFEDLLDDGKQFVSEVRRLRAGQEALLNEQRRLNDRLQEVWHRLNEVAGVRDADLFEMIDSVVAELLQLRANAAPPLSDSDRVGQIIENVSAKLYDKQAREDIAWMTREMGRLRSLVKDVNRRLCQVVGVPQDFTENTRELVTSAVRHIKGTRTELGEVHDILAEALGYEKAPTAEEDPNCPCPGDFITGEHTAVTLAAEAAGRIKQQGERIARLRANYKESRATIKRMLGVPADGE